jgi:RNA polymerase sigma-70 factor (ECF subfamily)
MSVLINEASTSNANAAVAVNSQESDAALVEAARRRDPEAFKELVTRYGPRIFRVVQGITRNREDAEEVSQDSFTRAFLHMDTFRGDSRLYTWLARIAINQSLMKLRTRRLRELHFDRPATTDEAPSFAEVADNAPTPEQRYSQMELRQILATAMSKLPLRFREVLYLREVEERSTEETARMLGLSISAVKSRALRGRQKLHQVLTKYFRPSELDGYSTAFSSGGRL